jgi:ABC-2 type transport system permease protein
MMSRILTIAWKDTLLRFTGASELLFFIILPVVFIYLLSGGPGGGGGDEDNGVPLAVVDEDQGRLSADLLVALQADPGLRPELLPAELAAERLAEEEALALLTIPAGLEEAARAGQPAELALELAPNRIEAQLAQQAVAAAVGRIGQSLTVAQASLAEAERLAPFADDGERQAYFDQALSAATARLADQPDQVVVGGPAAVEEDFFDMAGHASAGQLITWVFIPLVGTSGLLALERSQGTLRRLVSTPTSALTYLLGTIAGQFGLALAQMALLVAFALLVLRVDWGAPAGLAVVLSAFALASVALGVMLGTFVRSESQAGNLSIMLGMVMAMLGGCWWPIELFPPFARQVAAVLPTRWAMQGLSDLIQRDLGLAAVLPEAGVLLAFAALFLIIGVWRFRYE